MAFQGDSIFWVEVEKVVPNPFQPRREFDEERLQELADSIRMYGVLQPLTVTRKEVHSDSGAFRTEYELIAGERRLRASRLAGVAQVPVIIRSGEQTEQEKLELAIIENLQREDLNAVDRALAFKQLAEVFKLSHAQVAKKVGRSREYVSNSIRLLALPEHMLDGLKRGDITEGHARTLLMLKDRPDEQEVVYREILLKKLSVREVERIARKIATDKVRKQEYKDTDAHLIEIEREFTDALGTRVQILKTDFGGKLTIDYFSEDDLDTLLKAMKSQNMKIAAAALATVSPQAASVGETVIREMDQVDVSAVSALEDSTPLMVMPSKELSVVADELSEEVEDEVHEGSETDTSAQASAHEQAHSSPESSVPTPEMPAEQETETVTEEEVSSTNLHSPVSPFGTDKQSWKHQRVEYAEQPSATTESNHTETASREEVSSTQESVTPSKESEEAHVPSDSVRTEEMATATTQQPAPTPEPVISVTTGEQKGEQEENPAADTPTSSQTESAAVSRPHSMTENDTHATEASVTSAETNDTTSSLRARLEAELARLDAEAGATPAGSAAESGKVTLQNEHTPSVKQETEKPSSHDEDDGLYSIRNFSV